jgi:hypothetical protein
MVLVRPFGYLISTAMFGNARAVARAFPHLVETFRAEGITAQPGFSL